MPNNWTIEAKIYPIGPFGALGTHMYLEVWDGNGDRYAQLHGYGLGTDGKPTPMASDGNSLKAYIYTSNGGINQGATRDNYPEKFGGTVLFSGSETDVKIGLNAMRYAQEWINQEDFRYKGSASGNITNPNTGESVPSYNSNSVWAAYVEAMQSVINIPQSAVDQAVDEAVGLLGAPGADKQMLDEDWFEIGGQGGNALSEPISIQDYQALAAQFGLDDLSGDLASLVDENGLLVEAGVNPNGTEYSVYISPEGTEVILTGTRVAGQLIAYQKDENFHSSDAVITRTYHKDGSGNWDTEDADLSINFNGINYQGELAGQIFGSQLGALLGDGNVFAEVGLGTLGSAIAGNISEFIGTIGQSLLAERQNVGISFRSH